MSHDKARQIGNNLACLATSLAKMAEEIMEIDSSGQDREDENNEPKAPATEPQGSKHEQPQPPPLEEVRAYLAEKSCAGHTSAIREILLRHGANKLSEVDPTDYAAVLDEARGLV